LCGPESFVRIEALLRQLASTKFGVKAHLLLEFFLHSVATPKEKKSPI